MRDSNRALILSTLAFAISFALWGMIAPLAKTFQTALNLSEQQVWLLIATPVILGSLMRLPMGMMADRFGGRIVLGVLLLFIAIAALLLSLAHSYAQLLFWALILGMAGTSFSVGIAFTTKWFPADKQGLVLGVFGAGNIGQSLALFGVPVLAGLWGWQWTYRAFALTAFVYGVLFLLFARNAPVAAQPKSFGAMLKVLAQNPMSWLLSLFYFVTFGGFVALSLGLPKLLQEVFHLTKEDAGLRVAGFVVLATAMRPLGGWLSDRIGGARLLMFVFVAAGLLALGMTQEQIVPFTIGALGVAAAIGLGNGAVFKLVPEHFPKDTGTVTGLVGAMGGLGGFFPPLVLGVIKTETGAYDLGFVLLSVFCFLCLALTWAAFLRKPKGRSFPDPARSADGAEPPVQQLDPKALRYGLLAALLTVAIIYFGSGSLKHFDPALIAYTSACIFAAFGIVYRHAVWLQRPPTAMYWRRGWQLFLRPSRLLPNAWFLVRLIWRTIVLQRFIERRSHLRWAAHFLISWGCIVAVLVTFPLVFGWVHFEAHPKDPLAYQAFVFGIKAGQFPSTSLIGWVTFHILDFCAIAVIAGMAFSFSRRMYDPGAMSVQQFAMDFLPLILLLSVSITGLMLTASALWMHGHSYSFIAILHAFSVIVTLLYLPFGKFFHIFQRPANLGVQYYKQESAETPQALCKGCGSEYASRLHVEDLKVVLDQLGLDQQLPGGGHYQEICPSCRRRNIALNQMETIGGPGFL